MIVYLTGGIGTGKSTVLGLFAELGATVVSADDIVRALYAQVEVQAAVAAALQLPLPLDRARLADLVFTDRLARLRLEGVIHPLVASRLEELRAAGGANTIVYEIPLPPQPQPGDRVVVVTAPEPLRVARLIARGMRPEDAERRIAAQPDAVAYGKQADYRIVNDGDIAALRASVTQIWEAMQHDAPAL